MNRLPQEVKRARAWLENLAAAEKSAGAGEPNATIIVELLAENEDRIESAYHDGLRNGRAGLT